jgi:hypothetical protein
MRQHAACGPVAKVRDPRLHLVLFFVPAVRPYEHLPLCTLSITCGRGSCHV